MKKLLVLTILIMLCGCSQTERQVTYANGVTIIDFVPKGCVWNYPKTCKEMFLEEYPYFKGEINNTSFVPELCRFKIDGKQYNYTLPRQLICGGKATQFIEGELIKDNSVCASGSECASSTTITL